MSEITRVVFENGEFVEPASNNTPPPTGPAPTPAPTINAHDGVMRHQVGADGSVESTHDGVTRMDAASLFPTDTTGILATAKSPSGRPLSSSEIAPDSIVSFHGMTMEVRHAVHAGLLKQDANGKYVETSAAEQDQASNGPKAEQPHAPETFSDPKAEASLSTLEPVITQITAKMLSGSRLTEAQLDDYAAATGLTRETLVQNLATTFAAFDQQADTAAKSLGITDADLPAFWDWAKANRAEELAQALRQNIHARSTEQYKKLADQWLRSQPPSIETLRAAGYRVGRTSDGKAATVYINGTEMTVATAAKQGLI